jgi:hypothetical protein
MRVSRHGDSCVEARWFRRHVGKILAITLALALALQYALENLPYLVRVLNWLLYYLGLRLIYILPVVLRHLRVLLQLP